MTKIKLYAASLAVACSLPLAGVWASDSGMDQDKVADAQTEAGAMDQDGQPIAGYKLMTPEERQEFKDRMQGLDSAEQRQAYRSLHRDRMTQRAKAQGMDLEDIEDLPATAAGQESPASDDMESDKSREDPLSEGEGEVQ